MARLIDRFLPAGPGAHERYSFGQWAQDISGWFSYNGNRHVLSGRTLYGSEEGPAWSQPERSAVLSNGMVYGLVRRRVELFAQARFVWKRLGAGPKPMAADTFTTADLAPLDNPTPILERMELDVATAGNSYWTLDGGVFRRLPPEWVTVVLGSQRYPDDPGVAWDAEVLGFIYKPENRDPEAFLAGEVVHYSPEADPDARFRGMSYLRPAMEDISADNGARRFLTRYFSNSATPNLAAVFPPETTKETVEAFRDIFLQKHQGVERAFRTAFLGGGADLKVIGANLKDLDSEHIRRQVHEDICMAAGIPPIAAGILPGTYTNTKESHRALADTKLRYLWLAAVEAFRPALRAPSGTELWYSVEGVSALQSDALDDAQVMAAQANTMRTLADGGWDPATVQDAVTAGDWAKMRHTGNLSVQLLPPGQSGAGSSGNEDDDD